MHRPSLRRLALVLALTAVLVLVALPAQAEEPRLTYPETRQVDQVDTYHGTSVADPYRWLEEDIRESEPVRRWVEAQNRVTNSYLEAIPEREPIRRRLTELWDYERVNAPWERGGRYFFSKNDGLQDQSVLYVRESLDGEPRVLLDPNGWSEDGTVALAGTSVSPNGELIAYAQAASGSDWQTWKVRDVATGRDLPDQIDWVKFTNIAWTEDGAGFFYSRFPRPEDGAAHQGVNLNQKLYYHRLGTSQEEDVVAYEDPDHPEWSYIAAVTEDGRYLVIVTTAGTAPRYRVLYRDLEAPFAVPTHLVGDFDHEYQILGNDGRTFYMKTDHGAPRGRIVSFEIGQSDPSAWRELVPESENALQSAGMVGDTIVASYLEDAKSRITLFDREGEKLRDVELPGIGSAYGPYGDRDSTESFYTFSSFTTPPSVYRYDVATGESRLLYRSEVDFDPDDYAVSQVFATSEDGTRVPIFLAHKAGIELDGTNPTLLYGYGGFTVSLTPSFSTTRLAWMEMGGVFALANTRGGGEYGADWHLAGTKLRKQNVFDDFIAAAEWLIDQGYTTSEKLAIQGGSNGGLLVGAVMAQRPDLFGAALPAVGVMDMLRFHLFTAGRYWVDDYGSAESPEEFRALHAYSPYHNLKDGVAYPATLVTTADTDDRVVPGHSFKFAARLQQAHAGDDPVLIRIETSAGHGAGKPTSKQIEEIADEWAFLVDNLDFELPPGYPGSAGE